MQIAGLSAAAVATLATFLGAMPAHAEAPNEPAAGPAYELSVPLDVPILLISGGLAASYLVLNEGAPPYCAPLCDRSNVNAFDRWAAGHYSTTWQAVGDVTTGLTLALVPLSLLLGEKWRPALNDAVVLAEAALVTSAIQVTTSYAVGRPRPRVYDDEAPLDQRNNANAARSFFSGHVANGVAITLVTFEALARLRHRKLSITVLVAGLAGSALIGVARVGAGGHFPSDVVAGAAVGAGVGIALPAMHASGVRVVPLALGDARGLALTATF
jgi:membrane-associated phospholipid phosphatase